MKTTRELRGALGRGLAAAGVVAAALQPAPARAAAPATAAWTKTWAEQQLRSHYDATTVACLPLGAARRANGSTTFSEFVCGLVLADGTRLSIHLKPRSRTAWTTVSLKRLGPSKVKQSGAQENGKGQGNASAQGHADEKTRKAPAPAA
jgi:hypothetical protein